jgi:hypothetical protein
MKTAARSSASNASRAMMPVWLFDLDNTLHNASRTSFRTSTAA